MSEVNVNDYYKIRPSARIISAIGDDLIKDSTAAIIELVKNAYDADAEEVIIKISKEVNSISSNPYLQIIIKDNGHGMSFDTVVNKWMVPGTDDKLNRKKSPKGRLLQGRKGIGRYSASILGDKLSIHTISEEGEQTRFSIDWKDVNNHQFLDEVDVKIEREKVVNNSGTIIEIIGSNEKLLEWNNEKIELLNKELKKLLIPINKVEQLNNEKDIIFNDAEINGFDIYLTIENFDMDNDKYQNEKIKPLPLIEMYDYRLHGTINKEGHGMFYYQDFTGINFEIIEKNIVPTRGILCGEISFDFRVFDKDPEVVGELVERVNEIQPSINKVNRTEIRGMLKEISGISLYREHFRIRPYGDSGYDWLNLDKKRVQNPSLRIGSDQVVGFVRIQNEELSNIEEQSSREGIKESDSFDGLKNILEKVINELEIRRFSIRKKVNRGRKKTNLEKEIEELFDFDKLTFKIEDLLLEYDIDSNQKREIENTIKETREKGSKIFETLRDTIALYQGQATLGKIVMVILHEGRKPLSWFKTISSRLNHWVNQLDKEYDEELLNLIIDRLKESKDQSDQLTQLFEKLKPLSMNSKKRGSKKMLNISELIEKSFEIFDSELDKFGIKYNINDEEQITIEGWKADFTVAFTNLIENSIFWLDMSGKDDKLIDINIFRKDNNIYIDYNDNGKGIEYKYLENDSIFEPGFTTKEDGTGLGLAIAGEAIERNGGRLEASYNKNGSSFRMVFEINDLIGVDSDGNN